MVPVHAYYHAGTRHHAYCSYLLWLQRFMLACFALATIAIVVAAYVNNKAAIMAGRAAQTSSKLGAA